MRRRDAGNYVDKHCILTSRHADLKNHADSKKHKTNAISFLGKPSEGRVQTKIPFVKEDTLHEAKSTEGRLALFVAQHTSINIVDHLTDLCKNCFKKCDAST
jgi:hypothetical protein